MMLCLPPLDIWGIEELTGHLALTIKGRQKSLDFIRFAFDLFSHLFAVHFTLLFSISQPSSIKQGSQYLAVWASKTNEKGGIMQCTCHLPSIKEHQFPLPFTLVAQLDLWSYFSRQKIQFVHVLNFVLDQAVATNRQNFSGIANQNTLLAQLIVLDWCQQGHPPPYLQRLGIFTLWLLRLPQASTCQWATRENEQGEVNVGG